MKSIVIARGVVALVIVGLLSLLAWYARANVDRAQLARWLHEWQHNGTSVQIDLAVVLERWQMRQGQKLERQVSVLASGSKAQNAYGDDDPGLNKPSQMTSSGRMITVDSSNSLLRAVKQARPGDRLVVAPGHYSFSGRSIELSRSGSVTNPITIAAQKPWQSVLNFNLLEGFWVSGSDWHFEGLTIQGTCAKDNRCEHAFHIVGGAQRTVLHNNRIYDFNAPIKVNGSKGGYPDGGSITHNAIVNTRPRQTKKPVVGIDGVAVSHWQVSDNLIANFKKAKGNRTSSGGFFKGAGRANRFDRNLVICSDKVAMDYIQIGLSLGNGGTSTSACRDRHCPAEQFDSDITGNIIMNCSDVGIYLNRAQNSTLTNNTLYATLGVDVRFEPSSAVIVNNVFSGRVRERDGGEIVLDQHNWFLPAQATWRDSFDDVFHQPQRLDFSIREHFLQHFSGAENEDFVEDACGTRNESTKGFKGALNPSSKNDCFSIAP